ncbi:MAG: transposase [Gammaproteobacteria bacterium]
MRKTRRNTSHAQVGIGLGLSMRAGSKTSPTLLEYFRGNSGYAEPPQRLGVAQLCASRPQECSLCLVHEYRRGPGRPRKHPRTARSTRGRQQHREPWLVATSLKEHSARWVIRLYRLRMKIEESFRDIKSHRFASL